MSAAALIFAGIAFLAFVVVSVVVPRFAGRLAPPVVAQFVALPTLHLVGLATGVAILESMDFWAYSIIYGFLAVIYMFAFGVLYKSVSVRLLCELMTREEGAAEFDDLFVNFLIRKSFTDRIAVLIEAGVLQEDREMLALTPRGRRIAERTRALQRIFRIDQSG